MHMKLKRKINARNENIMEFEEKKKIEIVKDAACIITAAAAAAARLNGDELRWAKKQIAYKKDFVFWIAPTKLHVWCTKLPHHGYVLHEFISFA